MEGIRTALTMKFPDTIAVVVVTGSESEGWLGMAVSSETDEEETMRLLRYVVNGEPVAEEWT